MRSAFSSAWVLLCVALLVGCGPVHKESPRMKAFRSNGFSTDSRGRPVGWNHPSSQQMTVEEMKAILKLAKLHGNAVGKRSPLNGIIVTEQDVRVATEMQAAWKKADADLAEMKRAWEEQQKQAKAAAGQTW